MGPLSILICPLLQRTCLRKCARLGGAQAGALPPSQPVFAMRKLIPPHVHFIMTPPQSTVNRYWWLNSSSGCVLWYRRSEAKLWTNKQVFVRGFATKTIQEFISRQFRWGVVSFADSLDCVGILAKRSNEISTIFGKFYYPLSTLSLK